MRIIAGKLGGRSLKGPGPKNTYTRPMLDRVREALFSILGEKVTGAQVLDLCAGTGSLGLEALSRGADFASFVERDHKNTLVIKHNIAALGVEEQSEVIRATLPQAVSRLRRQYDLIFFDPPFASDLAEQTVPILIKKNKLGSQALIVVERGKLNQALVFPELELLRHKIIGDSVLYIFKQFSGLSK